MDNPTYDENISTTATPSRIVSNEEDETVFQNPLYSDVGHGSANNSHHPYEDTPVSTSYENVLWPRSSKQLLLMTGFRMAEMSPVRVATLLWITAQSISHLSHTFPNLTRRSCSLPYNYIRSKLSTISLQTIRKQTTANVL